MMLHFHISTLDHYGLVCHCNRSRPPECISVERRLYPVDLTVYHHKETASYEWSGQNPYSVIGIWQCTIRYLQCDKHKFFLEHKQPTWCGYKLNGLDFFPLPRKLGNSEWWLVLSPPFTVTISRSCRGLAVAKA
jgi:hypothetical protein